jgi:hypothetical protein
MQEDGGYKGEMIHKHKSMQDLKYQKSMEP